MFILKWSIVAAILFGLILPLLTIIAYMAVSPLARLKENGQLDSAWWGWKAAGAIALIVGWPGDLCFNALYGSIIFRELIFIDAPRDEFTFSSRVQRHMDARVSPDYEAALRWALRLNTIWPGHIRMEPRT